MAGIDWKRWINQGEWSLEEGCKLVFRVNPNIKTRSEVIRNRNTRSHLPWVTLLYEASAAVKESTLQRAPGTPIFLDRSEILVLPAVFLAWVRGRGISIPPELAGIASPRPIGNSHRSQELNSKSLQSLLKMVIAMAIDSYGFKPEEKRSPTPEKIVSAVQEAGLSIEADTVRKWLHKAKELLL